MAPSLTRILDARGAQRVALSPDGGTLYYVSDLTGTMQLWRVSAAGGAPIRLSYECDRVGAYRVSSDGEWIAYGADEGGNERWSIWVMRADGASPRRLTGRPDRIHHVVEWSADGRQVLAFANIRDERFFDLYAFPADHGEPELLFRHDGTGFDAAALADGRIVVTTNRGRGDENHLTLVDRGRDPRRLTPEKPSALHANAQPYAGDGVLVLSDRDRDMAAIARVGLDGAFSYVLTPERVVDDLAAAQDRYAYALNVDGRSEVHRVDGNDRVVGGLPPGGLATDLIGNSLAIARDGTVAIAWARFDAPSAVYVARAGRDAELVVRPQMAGLAGEGMPEEELVSWRSFDGRTIPGFLLRPRGGGRGKRPTVVQVHGGPEGQARPLWNPLTVALVAAGFNVLQPNVRGSSGYGRAYMSLDDVRLRMDSVKDLDAAAAWLAESSIAPPERIGVIGG
ncbi:MAG: hypothetical protein E6I64_08965, partial [Chloroflexi bacterium]